MNSHALAERAYSATTSTFKSSRAVEYDVIVRITHDLKRAAQSKSTDFPKLAEAIHRNNRLWNKLAALVSEDANQLPKQLRAQIFYLAEFTTRHAAQVLAGKASVKPLLEINTAILRGLQQGEGQR